jgi:hypothetical protein
MTDANKPQFRPSAYVQIYLWVALLIASIAPAMLISVALFDATHFVQGVTAFGAMLAAFQGLLWYAQRRCSSPDLSAWDGLLYITSYMTIGVGTMSLFIAVLCAIVALLGLIGIAALSIGDGDAARAQTRFRSMVIWFAQHRMYQ